MHGETAVTCPQNTHRHENRLSNIARMYTEGFRQMTVGRSLWVLILLKLVILFAVLKLFSFPTFSPLTMTMILTAHRQCARRSLIIENSEQQ